MSIKVNSQEWLKPSEIASRQLIVNSKGKPDRQYIYKLIKTGQLKAKVWITAAYGDQPRRKWHLVSMKEVKRFNAKFNG